MWPTENVFVTHSLGTAGLDKLDLSNSSNEKEAIGDDNENVESDDNLDLSNAASCSFWHQVNNEAAKISCFISRNDQLDNE